MLHKVLKYLALVLSVLGAIFLGRIIATGDEEIKAMAEAGDTAIVDPIAYVGYVVLGLVLLFVIGFVIKNLITNTAGLKNTLIGLGAFVAVIVLSYAVSGGDTIQYKLQDGFATDGQSTMVGAGLVAFYILMGLAVLVMIYSGVKKVISK